jgi:hypothetical protein
MYARINKDCVGSGLLVTLQLKEMQRFCENGSVGLFNMVFNCFSTKNSLELLFFSSASIVVSLCAVLSVGFGAPFCQFAC